MIIPASRLLCKKINKKQTIHIIIFSEDSPITITCIDIIYLGIKIINRYIRCG